MAALVCGVEGSEGGKLWSQEGTENPIPLSSPKMIQTRVLGLKGEERYNCANPKIIITHDQSLSLPAGL